MVQDIRSFLRDLRGCLKHIFFEKKATFSMKNCNCSMFFRIVECDKSQETIYKCQKDILTINVQVIRVFLGPERLLKTQTFEKKMHFSSEQMYLPHIFSNCGVSQTSGND